MEKPLLTVFEDLPDSPSERVLCITWIHNGYFHVIGGYGNDKLHSKFLELDEVYRFHIEKKQWSRFKIKDIYPSPRLSTSVSKFQNSLYIFGGYSHLQNLNDLYQLNIENYKWRLITANKSPPSRDCHTSVVYNNHLVIYGGGTPTYNDLYFFDLINETWSRKEISNSPYLQDHVSFVFKDDMFVLGGIDRVNVSDKMFCLNLKEFYWKEISLPNYIKPRCKYCCVQEGEIVYFLAGKSKDGDYVNDILCLNIYTKQWKNWNFNEFIPRCNNTCSISNGKIVTFGGWNGSNRLKRLEIIDFQKQKFIFQNLMISISKNHFVDILINVSLN